MHWYDKLNEYFPIEEMKSQEHMEALLKDFPDTYHKDEGKYHVLMYVEVDDFIFIDYLYVSTEARGKGIGHKLLQKLKDKGKPIILEVEPVDYKDTDTQKRVKFYQREGFQHAKTIGYKRKSLATNTVNKMEILYWAPNNEGEEVVYQALIKTYKKIHTYNDKQFYGQSYEPAEQVIFVHDDPEKENIFDEI
ncbi:GNAT family N-acetyltransferase [Niallia sp. 01092]|uniref:GNAT family N-acetyltransferase n=1 Tax=unclassified Niallia TaxID=2837522 RepID=UPI003FCF1469